MKRLMLSSALPVLALLSACGGGNEIVTTNDNNVVLNDAHSNYAFANEGEMPANHSGTMSHDMSNGTMSNGTMSDGAMGNGTMSNAM